MDSQHFHNEMMKRGLNQQVIEYHSAMVALVNILGLIDMFLNEADKGDIDIQGLDINNRDDLIKLIQVGYESALKLSKDSIQGQSKEFKRMVNDDYRKIRSLIYQETQKFGQLGGDYDNTVQGYRLWLLLASRVLNQIFQSILVSSTADIESADQQDEWVVDQLNEIKMLCEGSQISMVSYQTPTLEIQCHIINDKVLEGATEVVTDPQVIVSRDGQDFVFDNIEYALFVKHHSVFLLILSRVATEIVRQAQTIIHP